MKFPIYNNDAKISGLFGCTVILGHQPLAGTIQQMKQLELLTPPKITNPNVYLPNLSKQENNIANHLLHGKTAKEIAKILNLSFRTVEHYIYNIKIKLNITSRSKLIAKLRESL